MQCDSSVKRLKGPEERQHLEVLSIQDQFCVIKKPQQQIHMKNEHF